ncbi:sulfate ABC transporter permease subunit CysT [Phaeovibrio sulfidiphilus]|uniref:Sulfate transport system permease protein CysT n=1 Tax=Phaeovibrio sulfidiphilus TaxID=1220600 RepID=A0A8J7CR53_9PROT|nr:sulfate ABC transporter permease subunit CysT [Phaeovibrio sulfidiphilus]MBE1237455.1 sulfate ABC transporter permease subunit CysT [Phaeovibrio sulfidiphilus]
MAHLFSAGKRFRVLPGFGLTLGLSLSYLGFLVLVPLAAVFLKASGLGLSGIWDLATAPRTLAALKVSFGTSLCAAFVNTVAGTTTAWVLVRYPFPGRRFLDAMVDLPFALPTAVAGLALATLYAPSGFPGSLFASGSTLGSLFPGGELKIAYAWPGIVVALVFIGLPFVVRTVQPVLEDLDREQEEAAATLGAGRLRVFTRVILPVLLPAMLTGFALAFARALGEYGSVIFIAGNRPFQTEIAPLLIVTHLEQPDYPAATALAVVMLVMAFAMMLAINLLQAWTRKRLGHP